MQLNNCFGDRKPKPGSPGTAGPCRIRTVKFIKDPFQILFRNRISLIFKTNPDLFFLLRRADHKTALLPAICDGISKNIIKYSGKFIRVSLDQDFLICLYLTGQFLLLQHRIQFIRNLLQHHRQIDFNLFQIDILQIESCDIKKFL